MPTSNYFLPAILLNPVLVLHSLNTYFSYRFPPALTSSTSPHSYIEKLGPLPGSTPFFDVQANDNLCWTYTLIMVCAQVLAYSKIGGNRIKKKTRMRREGKDIKHSRWSEPEENKDAEMDAIRREKRKERAEMDEENRRKNSKIGMGGVDGALDVDLLDSIPYSLRSQPRRQIRSIRSYQNGNKSKADQNGHSKHGSSEFAETIHQGIRGGDDDCLGDLELEDDIEIDEEMDEGSDDSTVETETSEEVMIL